MTGKTEPIYLDMAEFMVEVHHERGNVSLFEIFDPSSRTWQTVDVWEYRRASDEWWIVGQQLWDGVVLAMLDPELDPQLRVLYPEKPMRVTRYPDLEKDMLDKPYIDAVPSWKIDLYKVTQFLKDGTVPNE